MFVAVGVMDAFMFVFSFWLEHATQHSYWFWLALAWAFAFGLNLWLARLSRREKRRMRGQS